MVFQDRLVAGFIAGVAGGILMNIYVQAAWFLNLAHVRYVDWAAVLLYGHRPQGVADAVFAQIVQLMFTGMLGVVFAYLIPAISSRYHLLRGALYGFFVYFLIYGVTLLFELHSVVPLEMPTVAVDFAGAGIFGLVLAEALHRLDKRLDV